MLNERGAAVLTLTAFPLSSCHSAWARLALHKPTRPTTGTSLRKKRPGFMVSEALSRATNHEPTSRLTRTRSPQPMFTIRQLESGLASASSAVALSSSAVSAAAAAVGPASATTLASAWARVARWKTRGTGEGAVRSAAMAASKLATATPEVAVSGERQNRKGSWVAREKRKFKNLTGQLKKKTKSKRIYTDTTREMRRRRKSVLYFFYPQKAAVEFI